MDNCKLSNVLYTVITYTKFIKIYIMHNFVHGLGLGEGCNCSSSRFAHKEPDEYRGRVEVRGWGVTVHPANLLTRSLMSTGVGWKLGTGV